MILAAAGYHVTLFEQNPIIAALLQDGLERAKEVPELREVDGVQVACHFADELHLSGFDYDR